MPYSLVTPHPRRSAAVVALDPTASPTLSVDEFAALAGISRSTAFAAVHNGEVPAMRFGKRIRIPTAAVRRMLELDDGGAHAPA
jgi:excisionase family DNA binding protein